MTTEFQKFRVRGAYHWDALRRSAKKHNPYLAGRYAIVLGLLGKTLQPGGKVLDIGCGDGALGYLLARAGWEVYGLDYSQGGLALAREKHLEKGTSTRFIRSDSCALPIHDGSFDAVVAADIIEHLKNPDELLKEIYRVTRTGGIAVITTPVKLSETPADPEHVREFSPEEFKAILKECFGDAAITKSHPVACSLRYEFVFRLFGVLGRIRPYRYYSNISSSFFNANPFLKEDASGLYSQMSALVRKQ